MTEPASIRYNNPGAMWGGKHANRWGAKADIVLNDGQKNHIAVFPDKVQGAAAQIDLWRRVYSGLTLAGAIRKWSGGNSSSAYMSFLEQHTGIGQAETITADLLAGPKGLALVKAQAQWEAGKPYPMTDEEWARAQRVVFDGAEPAAKPNITTHATAVSGAAAGAAAASAGLPWYVIAGAVVAAAAVAFIIFKNRS